MGEVKLDRDGLTNSSAAGDGCVNGKKGIYMKAYKLETIQKLDDGTHDIEGGFELPRTDDGFEQSLIIRISKDDNNT